MIFEFQLQAELGAKRVEANRVKNLLEAEIKRFQAATEKLKAIEKEIQVRWLKTSRVTLYMFALTRFLQALNKEIAKANHLMDNMTLQHDTWRKELKRAKDKVKTAPGDALLTAACVCYHGALDNRTRADLMHDWLNRCELGNFDPSLRLGKQVKAVSLSARLDTLIKSGSVPTAAGGGMPGTESVHSIQQAEYPGADGTSNRGTVKFLQVPC